MKKLIIGKDYYIDSDLKSWGTLINKDEEEGYLEFDLKCNVARYILASNGLAPFYPHYYFIRLRKCFVTRFIHRIFTLYLKNNNE